MASELGNAYVNIVPKANGIESKVEGLLGGAGDGAERAGKSLGKKLLAGVAALGIGRAIGGMVKDAFEAGGALQQSFGGLDTIYGDAAAGAKQYAMEAAQAGISANEYAEQAVSFGASLKMAFGGDTTQAMEAANVAIMDMADNAAKMGTPLESIQAAYQGFAKQNYTMLDNLKLGYGGTKTEMERLLADAQAITGVEYNIDNLGDVYEAIHVIQGELGLTGVAADEAKTTLTGSMGAVKASWENVMAALTTGEGLETAMSNMGESVKNFANVVLQMFGNLAPQIPGLINGLVDIFIQNAPQFLASGVEMIVQVAAGLIKAIPDLIRQLPAIWNSIKSAFKSVDWWTLGRDVITGIINGIRNFAGNLWSEMQNLATSAWQAAKQRLGIGSPSKVFADEIGRWIPAGIAVGVDANAGEVESSVLGAVNESLDAARAADMRFYRGSDNDTGTDENVVKQLMDALGRVGFDLYLDGKQITECVTVRQRRAMRSGGVA